MLLAGRVETVGWLIQHQQPGLGEQGGGQPEPLTHAVGETANPVVGDIGEPDWSSTSSIPAVRASPRGARTAPTARRGSPSRK